MRRWAALLLAVSTAGPLWIVGSAPTVVAQEDEQGIGVPPGWLRWDADGNSRLDEGELEALTEEDWETWREWAQEQLNQNGGTVSDAQMRDWIGTHVDPMPTTLSGMVRQRLGIAGSGISDIPGDVADEVADIPNDVREGVTDPLGAAADSVFDGIANRVGEAAAGLASWVGHELARTGTPGALDAEWYQAHYRRMLGWAALLITPLALVAIGGAVVRGETARIAEVLLNIPLAFALGVAGISVVAAAGGLAQAMANTLADDIAESADVLGQNLTGLLVASRLGSGTVLILGLVIAGAALVTGIWLVLSEAAIYGVVLFFPLAFAGRAWPQTASWGRRLLTLALALVATKVVIFGLWAMVVDGLSIASDRAPLTGGASLSDEEVPLRSAVALAALLVLTALSPIAVMRLVPMIEDAQAAPTPGRVGSQALSASYQVASLGRMMGAGSGGGGRLPIATGLGAAGGGGGGGPPPPGPPKPGTRGGVGMLADGKGEKGRPELEGRGRARALPAAGQSGAGSGKQQAETSEGSQGSAGQKALPRGDIPGRLGHIPQPPAGGSGRHGSGGDGESGRKGDGGT